jgi:hypothetical protein
MDWKERKQQVCQAGTQINLFALNGVLTIGRLNQRYDKKGAFGGAPVGNLSSALSPCGSVETQTHRKEKDLLLLQC